MTRNYYTTSNIRLNWHYYCIFCGKKIEKVEESIDERDWEDHYPCTCEGAKKEQQLIKEFNEAKCKLNRHIEEAKAKNTILMMKKEQEKQVTELLNNPLAKSEENMNNANLNKI